MLTLRWVGVAVLGMSAFSRDAVACGGGAVTKAGTVGADTQRIFYAYNGTTTEVVAQISVPDASEDYGVLVPLDAQPIVDPTPIPSEDLNELDRATAPAIGQPDHDSGGCSFGCGAGADKGSGSVQVGLPVDLGPVSATVLNAEDQQAVLAWLNTNQFAISDSGVALLGDYTGPGRFFIALRRSEASPSSGATSVGVHYTVMGDGRALAMRFAQLGGAATQAFTVFVAADTAVEPSHNFTSQTLMELDGATLSGSGYRAAVAARVSAFEQKAFVLESVTDVEDLRYIDYTALGRFIGPAQKVTRLSTVVTAAVDEDVRFDVPRDLSERGVPSFRQLSLRGPSGSGPLHLGTGFALGFALIGRRRKLPS